MELFNRYGYIYKPLAGGSWASANEKWKLSDSELLRSIACVHPKFYLGCRSGKSSRFAVLDIDVKSRYHNKRQLDKLLRILSDAGLSKSSLYRSSDSGGWHLYIFFDEPINSQALRRQLIRLLKSYDFDIAKGMLEVFPHPGEGSQGMGLRLPLQPGWAWLDKNTLEIEYDRQELSPTKALELFIDALDGDANSYANFNQLASYIDNLIARKEATKAHSSLRRQDNLVSFGTKEMRVAAAQTGEHIEFVASVFRALPPGIISDNWYKGRQFHINGLTAHSQRAEAITCLSHYLFYGDPSRDLPALGYGYEQEREWAIREILASQHNGLSKDINRNRPEAFSQVERAANWRPVHKRKDNSTRYRSNRPVAWVRENANRKMNARKRILEAFEKLVARQRAFTTKELQEQSGCSRTTLYKHLDIWRQQYEDLAAGFFAICTHEYNAVGGAGPSKTKPPLPLEKEKMPPGRLAARRIAYEISMRTYREQQQKQKAAVRFKKSAEIEWRDRVASLTSVKPPLLPVEKIKMLMSVLSHYRSIAPYEEDASSLLPYLHQLNDELRNRAQGPQPPSTG